MERFKSFEPAIVEQVRLIGGNSDGSGSNSHCQRVSIKFRFPRNPVIGDKFASRAGQKGVCSQSTRSSILPFTESGMTPTLLLTRTHSPHVWLLVCLLRVLWLKPGPFTVWPRTLPAFQFSENFQAADYFGEQLRAAGYNYYGNEAMYSGISGQELRVDILHWLSLLPTFRHMVSDKFQVRTTGPVHNLTQQPVKGRKRAGGIRLGEMERDSLLAHGIAFVPPGSFDELFRLPKAHICTHVRIDPFPGFQVPWSKAPPANSAVHCQSCSKDQKRS